MNVFEFLLALYSIVAGLGMSLLVLLPGTLTTYPAVNSMQAAALVVLMAIGVSFVSLTIG